MKDTLVEMRQISKRFPNGVLANDRVDFSVKRGEIHALVGENGAGKSTLMHILTGIYRPDEGAIYLGNAEITLNSPAEAIKQGIGMVYQHFMLIPELTVLDNLILGTEPRRGPLINRKLAIERAGSLMEQYNLDLPLQRKVEALPVSRRQQVEILRCLWQEARVLVFDEPTSVLTPQESDSLLQGLQVLSKAGKTIIYISHKLREVLQIARQITIMRDGRVTGVVKATSTDEAHLAQLMVGREINLPSRKMGTRSTTEQRRLLEVRQVDLVDRRNLALLKKIDFAVAPGEILGIAAVSGNGQNELVEVVVGLRQQSRGQILIHGQNAASLNVAQRAALGLAYIPQDRRGRATAPWIGLGWNVAIRGYDRPPLSKGLFLDEGQISRRTTAIIDRFQITAPGIDADIDTLSGGNLQKVVVGRELFGKPSILIAEDPTQGLDIGSTEQVRRAILDCAATGAAVLLISQDLSEVLSLSDRILIMYEGQIVGERPVGEVNIEEIGLMMTGLLSTEKGVDADANADSTADRAWTRLAD